MVIYHAYLSNGKNINIKQQHEIQNQIFFEIPGEEIENQSYPSFVAKYNGDYYFIGKKLSMLDELFPDISS